MGQDVWTESVIDMAINKDFLMGYGAGKASGGGGGNPNYTETITATLANPFGTADKYVEYRHAYYANRSATASLTADVSALGFVQEINNPIDLCTFEGCAVNSDDTSLAYVITFSTETGDITSGYVVQDGVITDLTQYASLIPTTLTIYWHPMPGQ